MSGSAFFYTKASDVIFCALKQNITAHGQKKISTK
jgi:hypothetical protein